MKQKRTYKMDLELRAYENTLTTDVTNDYVPKVVTQSDSLTLTHISEDVAARSGKFESTEVNSMLEMAFDEMARAVASGYCISTPLFQVKPMASGVILRNELSLPVDRERVRVYASFCQGRGMRAAMDEAHLVLSLQPAPVGPYIADMTSTAFEAGSTTTRVPMEGGKMALVTGRGIAVRGTDPLVGLTLTSVSTPTEKVFIAPDAISPNTPSKLQFVLPAEVTEGKWTLSICTQSSSGGKLTKEPRTFTLSEPITVGDEGGGGDVEDPTA